MLWNGNLPKFGLGRSMRTLGLMLLAVTLSGCITLSDIATGAGATAGAVASSAIGLGPTGTAVLTVAGATTGAAVIEETAQTVTQEALREVTNPWQGMVLAFQALLNHAFELVVAIAIGVFAIPMVLTFVLGKVMPRRKEKEVMKENEVLKRLIDK